MHLHSFFLILALFAFLVALTLAVSTRRAKFSGYRGIAADVDRLARALGGDIFRDAGDLVVRGNRGTLPVLVRFSSDADNDSSGLRIAMQVPATFEMAITPGAAGGRQSPGVVRTADGLFDYKFVTTSPQPTMARMFVTNAGVMKQVKKLCFSSATTLRIESGKLEVAEYPFQPASIFGQVEQRLASMAALAESLRGMPGADAIKIAPFRRPGNGMLKPAIALGLAVAFLEAGRLSRSSAPVERALAAQAAPKEESLPADISEILYLQGWRLAREEDFDLETMNGLRGQGAAAGAVVHADFSGKNNNRDVAYILIDTAGIMRVVVLSNGNLAYDRRYLRILAASRIPATSLNAAEWRDPAKKSDGDGLLLVTRGAGPDSSVVISLAGGNALLNSPVDYKKIQFGQILF
jgi:hypothetical protein